MNSPISISRRRMLAGSLVAVAGFSLGQLSAASGTNPSRKIAITIDDGPAVSVGDDLDAFIRVSNGIRESFLAEEVPAIMFVNEEQFNVPGQRDARVALLEEWLDAGLDVGNHTYSHPRPSESELWRYFDDIVQGEVITRPLMEARGKKLEWYRYPYLAGGRGEAAQGIEDFLYARDYRIAPVSVSYADYNHAGPYREFLRADDKAGAEEYLGTVLNALDRSFSQSEQQSMAALGYEIPQTLLIHCNEMNSVTLRTVIQRIRDRGYTFVSIEEAMADPIYDLPNIRPGALAGGGLIGALAQAKRAASQGN